MPRAPTGLSATESRARRRRERQPEAIAARRSATGPGRAGRAPRRDGTKADRAGLRRGRHGHRCSPSERAERTEVDHVGPRRDRGKKVRRPFAAPGGGSRRRGQPGQVRERERPARDRHLRPAPPWSTTTPTRRAAAEHDKPGDTGRTDTPSGTRSDELERSTVQGDPAGMVTRWQSARAGADVEAEHAVQLRDGTEVPERRSARRAGAPRASRSAPGVVAGAAAPNG